MVRLREFNINDAPSLRGYLNNSNVTRYLTTSIPQPYKEEDADWWINEGSKAGIVRAIEYKGVFIGAVGANRKQFEQSRSAEVGYWLAENHWGKGIATTALRELSKLVFHSTDIVRLQAHVFEGNFASARVLEKAGYKLEGVLRKAVFKRGALMDASLYAAVNCSSRDLI
jgi:ribosomal-protein-alanine N-acetyltransferase